jgi:integrase
MELRRLKIALDEKRYQKNTRGWGALVVNKTFSRMRMLVLIALTTGMRSSGIFGLFWSGVMYSEGLLAVRGKLKGGKMRYVSMLPELAFELRQYHIGNTSFRVFPPEPETKSGRQRVEESFEDLLERAEIDDFRFHDLSHTFASWYMMNRGDLYQLAKILGHSISK